MESPPLPSTLEPLAPLSGWRRLHATTARLIADRELRKSGLSLFDQLTISGAGFATSIIIGRFGSQSQLGVYFLALTVILIARGVQAELVTAPYTIYRPRFQGRAGRVYSGSILLHQLLILLVSGVGCSLAAVAAAAAGASSGVVNTLWVLTLAGPVLLFREFVRQYSFARMDVVSAVLVDVFATAIQLAGLVWLSQIDRLQSPWVYAVLGVANTTAVIVWMARLHSSTQFERRAWAPHWFRNWRFARWALASQVVCSCTPFVMPWILAFHHGEAIAGVGAACATLVGLSHVFTTAIANLLTARAAKAFTENGVDALRKVLLGTTAAYVAVLGLFAAAVFLAGDQMMQLVYGGDYAGFGWACFLFAVAGLLNSLSVVAGNGLWALHRPQANLYADAVTLLGTFASAAILIPGWDVVGAASAAAIGTGLGASVRGFTLWLEMRRAGGAV